MIEAGERAYAARETAENMILAYDRGTPGWWSRIEAIGTPLVERIDAARMHVTFLFRDPGTRADRIYADVNGVTDHHSPEPQSLRQIEGTDVWFWQIELPSDWRGSYAFIPVTAADAPPRSDGDEEARKQRHREWWSRIAGNARPDPLNRGRVHLSGWGGKASSLHLPDALDQSSWRAVDRLDNEPRPPQCFDWHSARQSKRRIVWHHRTGDASAVPINGLPLVLLLDGRNWVERMPVMPVLDEETAAGRLPPAFYLFVDAIDGFHRQEDLAPNPLFWSAIREELMPLAHEIAPISLDSADHVVAGQSFGGLAALYAVLARPDEWGGAIAQSPSLWWPHEFLPRTQVRRPGADGELTRNLRSGAYPSGARRVFMEVGTREGVMIDVARTMRDALQVAGHEHIYREYEGGHDALCWRGGLIDGLHWLLAAAPSPHTNEESPE